MQTARQFVAAALAGSEYEHKAEVAVLLTSEVVTNALLHGGSVGAERDLVLTVRCSHPVIRVEIDDNNTRLPEVADASPSAVSGRGMVLVDALAAAWGVIATDHGKKVWFEVRK